MGILTNPNSQGSNKLLTILQRHGSKLGFLSYCAGIIWLAFLANAQYNLGTYFSENALLPGLVVENFHDGHKVETYMSELLSKEIQNGRLTPQHFEEMFHRIGFSQVEMQNFTWRDPITSGVDGEITGTNVYAVFRAKRAAGTESIVFNAPYFSKNAGNSKRNVASVALMMVLAEYFKEQVYWAKDIVFLVAEGHTGTLAWVKGHQEIGHSSEEALTYERVHTKAGNIQAAINVILEGHNVCSLLTKFHGINGQLPNLDLVNLLNKFFVREYEKMPDWEADIWKLISYMQIQATGTPTGSHGFFLKYGIESVTLTGRTGKNCRTKSHISFSDIGRTLEATFRSLNNLLERLHQSFFFYLKTTPNRFISIGLYFPPLCLLLLPVLLKGAIIWLVEEELQVSQALFRCLAIHSFAIAQRWLLSCVPKLLIEPVLQVPSQTKMLLHMVVLLVTLQFLWAYFLLRKSSVSVINAVYCISLLIFSTAMYSLSLFNPSLVIFLAFVTSPIFTLFFHFSPKQRYSLQFIITALLVGALSYYYPLLEAPVHKYLSDAHLYGNLIFDLVFLLIVPVTATLFAVV